MRRGEFKIVLDACVLAPANLCELFLLLAETPRLYTPLFSVRILDEIRKTQTTHLGFPETLANSWRSVVESHFPEAIVTDYDHMLPLCTNHEKDKHVVAAAIHAHADSIVTFNLKDFPEESVKRFGISVIHPSDYLITLYSIESGIVVSRLGTLAAKRKCTLPELLKKLGKTVPGFAEHVAENLGIA